VFEERVLRDEARTGGHFIMWRLMICSRHYILFERSNGEERDVQSMWHVLEG
jgi:hypothetical protein